MQNQTQPTTQDRKCTNYFRYEMKDTNQLLKDFISSNMADPSHHSQQTNNKTTKILPKVEESLLPNDLHSFQYKNIKKEDESSKESGKKAVKSQEDLQNQQNSISKCLIQDSSLTDSRKNKRQNSMEGLILQKFYLNSSENQDYDEGFKGSVQKYKSKDILDDPYQESFKETKKQRKGLANISLRVKNIVSEHKKLTYKQVSDFVLQCSQEEINLLEPVQRTKEVKNIKRRVYDALNVLVAVGILGKHQRCVCITEWTDIPGKKHSSQWHKINAKIEYLAKLRRNCIDKAQILNNNIEKYHAITALRNKHILEGNQKQNPKDNVNTQSLQEKSDLKLIFPVIVFCPGFGEDQNDKLSVELEEENEEDKNEKAGSKKSKIKVSGKNITMLGDFDCVLEMELQKYRVFQQEAKIIKELEEYANQAANRRILNSKLQLDHDFEEASIEEYFNDQMFQSK